MKKSRHQIAIEDELKKINGDIGRIDEELRKLTERRDETRRKEVLLQSLLTNVAPGSDDD